MQVDEGRAHGPAILEPGPAGQPLRCHMWQRSLAPVRHPTPPSVSRAAMSWCQTPPRRSTNPLHSGAAFVRAGLAGPSGTGKARRLAPGRAGRSRQVVPVDGSARIVDSSRVSSGACRRPRTSESRRSSPTSGRFSSTAASPPSSSGASRESCGRGTTASGARGASTTSRTPCSTSTGAYVDAGCDVVSTDTWSILGASELEAGGLVGRPGATHWMDIARLGIRLTRQAVEDAGRTGGCAVAFSVNGDVDSAERLSTLRLLLRALEEDPPDLLLMETMSLIRTGSRTRRSSWPWARGSRSGSRFAAAVTASAGCTASTGEGPRATSSAAPRAASRSSAPGRSSSTACRPSISTECCPGCAISPTCRSVAIRTSATTPRPAGASTSASGRRRTPARRRLAGGGRPDRGRLLRHLAGAHRRGRRPTRRDEARPAVLEAARGGRDRCRSRRASVHARRPGGTSWAATSTRCPFPEIIREPDVFVPDVRQPSRLAAPVGAEIGAGKRCLDVGCGSGLLGDPARAERRRARACGRHPAPGRREHARERVPKRRLGPGHGRRGRHLHVRARRALRRRRREPLPDARQPLRGVHGPPPPRLLGPEPRRPLHPPVASRRWPTAGSPT